MPMLVTGTPGCGKTTLVAHAASVGDVRFIDSDDRLDLCEWRNFTTGESFAMSLADKKITDDKWYATYGWYWNPHGLAHLLSQNSSIVLCGSAENIVDYYELFDHIYFLKVTEQELHNRLSDPSRENPFGKTAQQRSGLMKWQDHLLSNALPFDPTVLTGLSPAETYAAINSPKS